MRSKILHYFEQEKEEKIVQGVETQFLILKNIFIFFSTISKFLLKFF
jgi:hypothetical protein